MQRKRGRGILLAAEEELFSPPYSILFSEADRVREGRRQKFPYLLWLAVFGGEEESVFTFRLRERRQKKETRQVYEFKEKRSHQFHRMLHRMLLE